MSGIIPMLLGVLIVFPFLVTFLVFIFLRKKGRAPSKDMGVAADITTPFLFIAVYIISLTIFDISAGFYIAIFAIIIPIIFAIIERMRKKDFRVGLILRRSWRLFFLILTAVYFVLLIAGVVLKIVEYAQ